MKKYLLRLSLLFLCIATKSYARQEYFSRSFMFTRPGYWQLSTQQALWHDIIYSKKGNVKANFQLYPFFQKTIHRPSVDRYFLFKGKNELLVAGDNVTDELAIRDVRAEWLGLPSNFSGVLTVNPHQQQIGFVFEYLQHICRWSNSSLVENMFIDISMPVVYVENNLELQQFAVVNPGTTFPRDIIEAFDQPAWQFSKVAPQGRSRTSIAELKFLLGSCYLDHEFFQVNYYSLVVIPIAARQNAEFLFDPVVGNNHHICIGGAANFQILLNRDPSRYAWCFFFGLESILRIKNKQHRTFDLVGKPWSRFMLYNTLGTNQGPLGTNVPGVNILTRKVSVRPYCSVDFTAGWRLKTELLELELGYNVWGRMHEHVDREVPEYPVPFGIAGNAPGTTASQSTIAYQAPNDPISTTPGLPSQFVTINSQDLDRSSAEAASSLNQKISMSIGLIRKGTKRDVILGGGWLVDIPQKNSALEIWNIWIKLGTTF